MSYTAFYREHRPKNFDEIVSQEAVVTILRNSIKTGRIAHAYLFCGTRGTGKTSVAQIFARAVNCLAPDNGNPCNKCSICTGILSGAVMDVLEIDAASNNSVDNIREIREQVVYAPSNAAYKVYIIDEVHMLSTGAFNALLKTLEEPPVHVIFILATTEPHKIPATILSRCQRFDFGRIPHQKIVDSLSVISKFHNVDAKQDALEMIASLSDGALRDALSILDQCIGSVDNTLTINDVLSVTGLVNYSFMDEVVTDICNRNIQRIMEQLNIIITEGKDLKQFISDLTQYFRNMLLCKIMDDTSGLVNLPPESLAHLKKLSSQMTREDISVILKELAFTEPEIRRAYNARILVELSLIKICTGLVDENSGSVVERLSLIEQKIASGNLTQSIAPASAPSVTSLDTPLGTSSAASSDEPSDEPSVPSGKGKTNGPSPVSIQNMKDKAFDKWNDVLDTLRKSGKMGLYSNLISAHCIMKDNNTAEIFFSQDNSLSKMLVSRHDNMNTIKDAMTNAAGRSIEVKLSNTALSASEEKELNSFEKKMNEMSKKINIPIEIVNEE